MPSASRRGSRRTCARFHCSCNYFRERRTLYIRRRARASRRPYLPITPCTRRRAPYVAPRVNEYYLSSSLTLIWSLRRCTRRAGLEGEGSPLFESILSTLPAELGGAATLTGLTHPFSRENHSASTATLAGPHARGIQSPQVGSLCHSAGRIGRSRSAMPCHELPGFTVAESAEI